MSEPKAKPPKRKPIAASVRPWTMKVNGHAVQVIGLKELALLAGKSRITLRQWETKGWLPLPNMRSPVKGKQTIGARLYTYEAAQQMAQVIKTAEAGVEVSAEIKHNLLRIIRDEREKLKHAPTEN